MMSGRELCQEGGLILGRQDRLRKLPTHAVKSENGGVACDWESGTYSRGKENPQRNRTQEGALFVLKKKKKAAITVRANEGGEDGAPRAWNRWTNE